MTPNVLNTFGENLKLDRHGFAFRVGFQTFFAEFPSVAAHLESAKGCCGVKDVIAIDPNRAGSDSGCEVVRLGDVTCPNSGRPNRRRYC